MRSQDLAPPPAAARRRLLGLLGGLALIGFLFLVGRAVWLASRAPALCDDLLASMALALEWQVKDPVLLHRRTAELARAELPPAVYEELTAPGTHGERFQDASTFHEHLPFQRARVLYTIVLSWLHQLGSPLSAATWWVPLAAYAMLALLALAWSLGHVPLWAAALIALAIALTPGFLDQASCAGAQGLAALFVSLGAFFLVERRLFAFGAAILTLAIAARQDTLVLVGALALAIPVCQPRGKRPGPVALLLWVAASAALFLGLQRFAGDYGWWPRFQHELVAPSAPPATLASTIDWSLYREVLARELRALPRESPLVVPLAALALLGVVLGLRSRARHGRETALLAALLATLAVRFLVIPRFSGGALASFYVLIPVALVAIVARTLRGEEETKPARAPSTRRRR